MTVMPRHNDGYAEHGITVTAAQYTDSIQENLLQTSKTV